MEYSSSVQQAKCSGCPWVQLLPLYIYNLVKRGRRQFIVNIEQWVASLALKNHN